MNTAKKDKQRAWASQYGPDRAGALPPTKRLSDENWRPEQHSRKALSASTFDRRGFGVLDWMDSRLTKKRMADSGLFHPRTSPNTRRTRFYKRNLRE